MFNIISDRIVPIFLALLAIQAICPTLAAATNRTRIETNTADRTELEAREGVAYKIIYYVEGKAAAITAPDENKICGYSAVKDFKGTDGVEYEYYVYTYTTGSDCDTTQRAKTTIDALSDAFEEFHSEGLSAVCTDMNHGGTWHGVLGLVTKASGKSAKDICSGHHAGAKRRDVTIDPALPELEAGKSSKRDATSLEKRTGISVSQSSKKSGSTKFSAPNESQKVILGLANEIALKSQDQNCDPVTGRLTDFNGVTYNYYYEASGRNCDTTAQMKTIVSAIDDAWNGMDSLSAVCMTLDHGGTWRGHLGVSAMQSDYPAQKLC
ncbi:uncharacterized protein N7459_006626 [Penicillium hispanicum]|uniref:uncharacterized protein n=1 Tax=Penicillium hispanicum TaxID=1080232 RepID=UPI00253FFD78|nr:uncharacterized protein N7459_006626 [Penicillium hispanicum]KAJ5577662.1 hypothetical protein N7459_006626 [Penicillium hispanicum]